MEAGFEEDFDAFYGATYRRLLAQVFAVAGNLHEAEDCVQEAYARAWQRWDKLSDGHGNPEAWVRVAAVRLAVSSWRKAVNRLKAHRRENPATEVSGMTPDHPYITTPVCPSTRSRQRPRPGPAPSKRASPAVARRSHRTSPSPTTSRNGHSRSSPRSSPSVPRQKLVAFVRSAL
jgi:hypothetical protein